MNPRTRSRRSDTGAMIADMREALQAVLGPVSEPVLLPGGASKEAWAVDADGRRLLVRRAGGGVIHRHTLSLKHEFEVLQAAHAEGVKVPEPVLYVEELDEFGEPHPAIELGLWWLRENRLPRREPVVVHGDYRIGNLAVDENGLVAVLDWEFAHLDDPARDLSFALVRAWRFGVPELRLGGIADVETYLERYNELTGFDVRPEELDYWELAGNVAWALGCLTQAQRHLSGRDRSVELAILGRLGAEVEHEICHLLEAQGVT